MNRKVKILLGVLIIVIFIGFIGVNVFSIKFDEDSTIEKLSNSIKDKDVGYLKDHIEIEGKKEKLTEKEIKNISSILNDRGIDKYYLKNLYDNPEGNIYVKKDGKEKLVFDKYTIVLKPYNLTYQTNLDNVDVYLNDKKIGNTKDGYTLEYKNLIPGKYNMKSVYKGEYTEVEKSEEITFFDEYLENIEHYTELEAYYINIYSNMDDASLFINDKDSGIKLSNYDTELGPISVDGSIKLQAKKIIDGKTYESDIKSVEHDGGYELHIEYEEPEEEIEDIEEVASNEDSSNNLIKSTISGYLNSLVDAINSGDFSKVSGYLRVGSPLIKSQESLVKNLSKKGTKEELINFEISDIKEVSNKIYEAKVKEDHKIYYSDGKEKQVSNDWIYTINLQGHEAQLSHIK